MRCRCIVLANHLALWSKRAWLNKFIVVQNHGKIMYQPKRFVFFSVFTWGTAAEVETGLFEFGYFECCDRKRIQKVLNIGTKKCCMLVIWFTQADSSHCRVESDWIGSHWIGGQLNEWVYWIELNFAWFYQNNTFILLWRWLSITFYFARSFYTTN